MKPLLITWKAFMDCFPLCINTNGSYQHPGLTISSVRYPLLSVLQFPKLSPKTKHEPGRLQLEGGREQMHRQQVGKKQPGDSPLFHSREEKGVRGKVAFYYIKLSN